VSPIFDLTYLEMVREKYLNKIYFKIVAIATDHLVPIKLDIKNWRHTKLIYSIII
jgi:hypothetical protein